MSQYLYGLLSHLPCLKIHVLFVEQFPKLFLVNVGSCRACGMNNKMIVHLICHEYLGGRGFQLDEIECLSGAESDSEAGWRPMAEEVVSPAMASISSREEQASAALRKRPDSRTLRRRMLGLIRCYYLDAISRLPTEDL